MSYTTTPSNWSPAQAIAFAERHGPAREPSITVGPTPPRDYPPEPLSAARRRGLDLAPLGSRQAKGAARSGGRRKGLAAARRAGIA